MIILRAIMMTALAIGGAFAIPVAAQQGAPLVRVDAVRSEPMVQTVPVIGRLVARRGGPVAARISGPVEDLRVEVGDRVSAGDVLAVLDRTSLRASRDITAGGLEEAQARLATRQAELDLAKQEMRRMEGLETKTALSQKSFDDQRQQVRIARAQIAEAKATVSRASADLSLAEINLSYTEIRAPYAGVITQRLTEIGAYVNAGEALVRMVSDEKLEIEADVPFRRLDSLVSGTDVELTLSDGTRHGAVVRAVVPEENPLTRTRAVRFSPSFGDVVKPLAVGQSVTLHIPLGAPRQVLTVHKDAIIKRQNQSMVFVVEDEAAASRQVTLGEAVGGRFEVLDNLNEGDRVVVRGNERLRPGDKVRIDGES